MTPRQKDELNKVKNGLTSRDIDNLDKLTSMIDAFSEHKKEVDKRIEATSKKQS